MCSEVVNPAQVKVLNSKTGVKCGLRHRTNKCCFSVCTLICVNQWAKCSWWRLKCPLLHQGFLMQPVRAVGDFESASLLDIYR